jgi:hypothetical protein
VLNVLREKQSGTLASALECCDYPAGYRERCDRERHELEAAAHGHFGFGTAKGDDTALYCGLVER